MFTFTNPFMLLGLLLIGIPILIHILNRSRYRVEPWGAMMFLQKAMQIRSQRIKVEQILLLILRCLFLILLALALSRPIANWGTGAWDDPTTHMIIFDGSYSMHQGEGEENAFKKAKNVALKIVDDMRDKDNMLVVQAGNAPRSLFSRPSFDKKFLRELIEEQEAGYEQTIDLPKTLDHAGYMLNRATLPRHRVYFLTDGQLHGWRENDKIRWDKTIEGIEQQKVAPHLYVLSQKPEEKIENIAITRVYGRSPVVDVFRPSTFLVELNNTTPEKKIVKIEFRVDGILHAEKDFDCPPGVQTADFEYQFSEEGTLLGEDAKETQPGEEKRETSSHRIDVKIDDDDLLLDNVYTLALEVRHTVPILVIDGSSAEELWASEGGMLALALRSAGAYGKEGLFTVSHKSLTDLEDMDSELLVDYRAVVLADVPSISRNQQFALEQFVEKGGGLMIALGEGADAEFYNKLHDEGKGLFPAEMVEKVEYRKNEEPFHPRFPAGAANHILDIFDTTRARVLTEARVTQYWRCKAAEDAKSFAFFNEDPFLMYRPFGAGMVILWSTTVNHEWSNLPMTQDYLPLVQNFLIYLSSVVQPPINLNQMDTLVYAIRGKQLKELEGTNALKSCTVVTPNGKEHEVEGELLGGEWVAEWQNTITTGLYTVKAEGIDPKYYAVAFKPGEENLTALEEDTRETMSEKVVHRFLNTPGELEVAIQEETGVSEWWRWFVFGAIGLLCGELFLGLRFSA